MPPFDRGPNSAEVFVAEARWERSSSPRAAARCDRVARTSAAQPDRRFTGRHVASYR